MKNLALLWLCLAAGFSSITCSAQSPSLPAGERVDADVALDRALPLVLHFSARIDRPIPILTVDEMKLQKLDCKTNLRPGTHTGLIRVSVDEHGVRAGMEPTPSGPGHPAWTGGGAAFLAAIRALEACHYAPYLVNGQATFYKGDVEVKVP